MAMNPAKLPRKAAAAPAVVQEVASAPAVQEAAAPPAHVAPAPGGEAFTGLDPLTKSLVEASPLVTTTRPPSQPLPPSQLARPEPKVQRRTLKKPALLVALGGTLAAGMLVLVGFRGATRRGHPATTSAPSVSVSAPAAPVIPSNPPSWLIAGGQR